MPIRMTKPWRPLATAEVARLTGQLGVYEVADEAREVLAVGFAGGRSRFGLRGELQGELARRGPGFRFRVEVNSQYHTRYRELLMLHLADRGSLPPENDAPAGLGRLSPA